MILEDNIHETIIENSTDDIKGIEDLEGAIEHEIEAKQILYLAVIFNDFQAYLVKSDIYQNDNDIEITEEQYNFFLDANNRKQAELRIVELEDGTLAVKDFYNPRPSLQHNWNKRTQEWSISKEDNVKLKAIELEFELKKSTDAMNKFLLLGMKGKAKESAERIHEIELELEALK